MNDLSTVDLGGPIPGIRKLKDSEIVRCGAVGLRPCTREGTSPPPSSNPPNHH